MNAFQVMACTLKNDPNTGIAIAYRPAAGGEIRCRASFVQPDIEVQLQSTKAKDRKRILAVNQMDVPVVTLGDEVDIPEGGSTFVVANFSADDPHRIEWQVTVTPL